MSNEHNGPNRQTSFVKMNTFFSVPNCPLDTIPKLHIKVVRAGLQVVLKATRLALYSFLILPAMTTMLPSMKPVTRPSSTGISEPSTSPLFYIQLFIELFIA